jgi:SAM-dependent methyltransferase
MKELFGPAYAETYDAVYGDKDYEAECNLLERLFTAYGDGATQRIVDLGCGTGNHALLLGQRGYEVVGVDRSASMIAHARRKLDALAQGGRTSFHHAGIASLDLTRSFDAALFMFTVLGYQLDNGEVLDALTSARRHLRHGGLLIFDVWYGPAVVTQRPGTRRKETPSERGRIVREARGSLDVNRQLCTVDLHVQRFEGDRIASETWERHELRFFFPLEIELFLRVCGFQLQRLGSFPQVERDPDENTWNVLAVARAV